MSIKVISAKLSGVLLVEPAVFIDERGFFMETYQARTYAVAGIPAVFVQDNHSGSKRGILRGLHYQITNPQAKLVQVFCGEVFDVVVDLRRSSTTFGKWMGVNLSEQNRKQIWIPAGFAHGFYVLSDWAEVIYKTTDFYSPQAERTIRWDDPDLSISWPLIEGCQPGVSRKDTAGTLFRDADLFQ